MKNIQLVVLSVDSRSGIVSLMKPLDFETKRLHKFKLTASDSMQLTSETVNVYLFNFPNIHFVRCNKSPFYPTKNFLKCIF